MLNAHNAWPLRILAPVILSILASCGGGGSSAQKSNSGESLSSSPDNSNTSARRSSSNQKQASSSLSKHGNTSNVSISFASQSSLSKIDLFSPTPSNLFIRSVTANSVALAWTESKDDIGIDYYKIIRTDPDKKRYQIIVGGGELSYIDTTLTSGNTYLYEITAYDYLGKPSKTLEPRIVHTPSPHQSSPTFSSSMASLGASSSDSLNAPLLDENGCLTKTTKTTIYWLTPQTRLEGGKLNDYEISHYEIRFKSAVQIELKLAGIIKSYSYTPVILTPEFKNEAHITFDKGDCDIEIAAVDMNGIKGKFGKVN